MSDNFTAYKVGELYKPDKTAWPQAYEYNYRYGQHQLKMFVRFLQPREILDVRFGMAKFALSILGDIIFLHFRFGVSWGWSDCPYSIHLVIKAEGPQKLPPLEFDKDIGAGVTIFLIEAETGILQGLRGLSFNHQFSKKLHRAIHNQFNSPFDESDYDSQVRAAYAKYTSDQLVKRSIAKSTVGEK